MKRFVLFIFVIICFTLFSACKSSTKMTINGVSGSLIYSNGGSSNKASLGKWDLMWPSFDNNVVSENRGRLNTYGSLNISQSDHAYIGLGLSINNDGVIPFAFDYKNRPHIVRTIFAWITGIALPMWILEVPEILICRGSQDAYEYHYKYQKNQITNQDLKFTKPEIVLLDPPLSIRDNNHHVDNAPQTVVGGNNGNDKPSSQEGTVSQKKLKNTPKSKVDLTKEIVGRYVGSGSLTLRRDVIESYKEITVTIKRIENDVVGVNVIEPNGDRYFSSDINYSVQKNEDGTCTLTEVSDNKNTISISKYGIMQFEHSNVIIENEKYQLMIIARIKK